MMVFSVKTKRVNDLSVMINLYLWWGHVRNRSMSLDCFQLIQTPVQFFDSLNRHFEICFIWKKKKKIINHYYSPVSLQELLIIIRLNDVTTYYYNVTARYYWFLEKYIFSERKLLRRALIAFKEVYSRTKKLWVDLAFKSAIRKS